MRPDQLEALGTHAFAAHILHRKRLPDAPTYLIGFDTEFYYPDPDGAPVPICFQLADGQTGAVYPVSDSKIKLTDITRAVYRMHQNHEPQSKRVVLLSWWAQAELAVIDTTGLDAQVIPQGNGLFGLEWTVKPKRKPAITFQILDLSAYFASSDPNTPRGLTLAQAAKEAGFEKLTYPVAEATPDSLQDETFIEYALNDARLCWQIGDQLRSSSYETWAVNPFRTVSVGHLTTSIFRHEYVSKNNILQPQPEVREMALLAYRGSGFAGGLWARGVFEGGFAEYDAASMYPTAARELGELPMRNAWTPWQGGEFQERGIYKAEFKWPPNIKHRMLMASVMRPTGEGYGYPQFGVDTFSGFELVAAARLGCQIRIIDGWEYKIGPHTTSCLSDYLSHLVTHRDKHTTAGRTLLRRHYKAMGNVLIGKLGQHRKHDRIVLDVTEGGQYSAEFKKEESNRAHLSSVFMPEWWVLVVGFAKAVFGEVCAEFDALHGNVDAVVIRDPGLQEFTRRGVTFKRKASGQTLKLIDRNTWAMLDGNTLNRMATFGGKQTPEVAEAFRQWTGEELTVELHSTRLVRLTQAAGQGIPLLARKTHTQTMTLKAVTTPLEDFESTVEIRPVARPTRRKPGDPPRGQKAAEMRARLEASRQRVGGKE